METYIQTQTAIRPGALQVARRHTRKTWKATHPLVNEDALLVTKINVANLKPSGESRQGKWKLPPWKSRVIKYPV